MTIVASAADPASKLAACFSKHNAPPATMVIFGAAGDLTKRLVMPALYNLTRAGMLADEFAIIGVDHGDRTTDTWREGLTEMIRVFAQGGGHGAKLDEQAWSWLTQRMSYMRGEFGELETFQRVGKLLGEQSARSHSDNVLFYLAVADRFFGPVVE
jgi:glucose-6-phosphate 1-dehydrogenase